MSAARPDVYQDGVSAGSLVKARGSWLDLLAADALELPQRFAFRFHCPTHQLAVDLAEFLRCGDHAPDVRVADRTDVVPDDPWQLVGMTRPAVWSLPSLEHLFKPRMSGRQPQGQAG